MRDPERIDRVLNKIRVLWTKYPDLRFGQLVSNCHMIWDGLDLFLMEDDLLEAALDSLIRLSVYGTKPI